jgi:exopolysaccharide production protein ExoY
MKHFPSFEENDANSVVEPILIVRSEGLYVNHFKRVLDISIVLFTLPFTLTIILAFWMLVRRDGGPGFFGHLRVGHQGKSFKCWKLRSMHLQAEDRLEELLRTDPAAAKEWAENQKLCDDPRVTKLGRFLRKSSIDELPQIWNVLRGEMSVVGPRPVTHAELKRYGSRDWAYLSVFPGITGSWQVSGRNSIAYQERVAMDTEYRKRITLLHDISIILRTVMVVSRRTGG